MNNHLKKHWLVVLIFFLALAVRLYGISHNSIMFWYDQARDFSIAQSIIENGDLKIQGPSASGTNDTLYHGVLYYYLIAPVVFLSQGSPVVVSQYLAFIGSFAVFIVYAIGIQVFKSKTIGLISAFLVACSAVVAQQSTWLSNPQMLVLFAGGFYLFVWRVFFQLKPKLWDFISLGLLLGMCIQAGLFELYMGGIVLVAAIIKMNRDAKWKIFTIREFSVFIFTFLLSVSTMIVTQALLIHRKVLTETTSSMMIDRTTGSIDTVMDIAMLSMRGIQSLLAPEAFLLVFVLLLVPVVVGWSATSFSQKQWLLLCLTAPLWLLLVQYRDSTHVFIGFEMLIYSLFGLGVLTIAKSTYTGRALVVGFLLMFVLTQSRALTKWISLRDHYHGIQTGALLAEQIALMDKVYETAGGADFSVSSSTNPFGVNVTWGYLFNWYGNKKYGYTPTFVGPPQAGIVGWEYLKESPTPDPLHFTILEPDTGLDDGIFKDFLYTQDLISTPAAAQHEFGSLKLQIRVKDNNTGMQDS